MSRSPLYPALLAALSLFCGPVFSKPVTGMDEPGEGEPLRHYYWVSAMSTSYQAAKAYAQKAQAESQVTAVMRRPCPTGGKSPPPEPRLR
jgi:hypothetical protein